MQISVTKDELYTLIKNAIKDVISEEHLHFSRNKENYNPEENDSFLDFITDPRNHVKNKEGLKDISVNHDKYIY